MFCDESKFYIYKSDGRTIIWRKPNEEFQQKNITPTVKHGGKSVMVWGCMGANGVGNLDFIETRMTKYGYLDILKKNIPESVRKINLSSEYLFSQDNDPKHKSYLVREWLLYNVPKQLNPPPQSPDLNPIESLWELFDKRIRTHTITSQATLRSALQEEWDKFTREDTKKYVQNMKKRLDAVIKGYQTKY